MYRELAFIKVDDKWIFIHNIGETELMESITNEDFVSIVERNFILDSYELEINEDTLYVLSNSPIDCVNCQESKT